MLYLERERPNLEHTRTYTQKCIHTDYEGEGGTVKKPISYWAFVGKRCVEALCIAKDAGFKRIELEMDGTGDLTPKTTPPQLAELKSAAEEIGIQCCRDLDLYWKHSFPSDDVDERTPPPWPNRAKAMDTDTLYWSSPAASPWTSCRTG